MGNRSQAMLTGGSFREGNKEGQEGGLKLDGSMI